MVFFGLGKKDRVIDLSEGYKKKIERARSGVAELKKEEPSDSFSIFGNLSSSNSEQPESEEEKKKKFAKRLVDMTNKLDEISTQIYHLQQRVELLERKAGVRSGA